MAPPTSSPPSSPRNNNPSHNVVDPSHNVYSVDLSGNFDLSLNNPIVTFSVDASSSFTVTRSTDYCIDVSGMDMSGSVVDCSADSIVMPVIVHYTENSVVVDNSMQLVHQQGQDASGNQVTFVGLKTIDPSMNLQIEEDLTQIDVVYDDDSTGLANSALVNEIKLYAGQIQCSDFHGKGTIDDYTEIFKAAAKIANESKQIELDVDIQGFEDFASAADDLSDLFNGFILKLKNVNIIDDTNFLRSIANALKKIVNLSNVFGKFKETILATSTIQIPKSAHDTKVVISGVMDEIHCAMGYIGYFVDASANKPSPDANLSAAEHAVIDKAIQTIDNWNVLCEQGLSITMSNDVDISFIKNSSDDLKIQTTSMRTATDKLKSKLAQFHYC